MVSTATIKKNISLKDERLDIDHLDHYLLSFFIGKGTCEISVFDDRKNRLLLMESYAFDPSLDLLDNLKKLHHEHALIAAGFWKRVEVILRNDKFCQVPNDLYSGDFTYDYLKLNCKVNPLQEKYLSTLDDHQGCTTVFSVPNDLMSWFEGKYPKPAISYKHETAVWIKAATGQLDPKEGNRLLINLTQTHMQLAGFAGSKLSFCNQFELKAPERTAKLILMAIQQFSDQGQAISIKLWGVKSSVDKHLPILKRYYKNLHTGQRPVQLKMSYHFDELEEYEYFDVLSNFI